MHAKREKGMIYLKNCVQVQNKNKNKNRNYLSTSLSSSFWCKKQLLQWQLVNSHSPYPLGGIGRNFFLRHCCGPRAAHEQLLPSGWHHPILMRRSFEACCWWEKKSPRLQHGKKKKSSSGWNQERMKTTDDRQPWRSWRRSSGQPETRRRRSCSRRRRCRRQHNGHWRHHLQWSTRSKPPFLLLKLHQKEFTKKI